MTIDWNDYQQFTRKCVVYDHDVELSYLETGFVGELGELYSALAKARRGDYDDTELKERVKGELGDLLWFIARFADHYGIDLASVVKHNHEKLSVRMARNKIRGDGEER